jgi:GNAT superfamily N-acetyltransferase
MRWELDDGYLIDDDPARVDRDRLYGWLTMDAYWWSGGLSRAVFEQAVDASLTLSVLDPAGALVGFGRLVTDRATFAYWCDVYVEPGSRGRGLGHRLSQCAVDHPAVSTCRRIVLVTGDAHEIYAAVGFTALATPETFMELHRPSAAV